MKYSILSAVCLALFFSCSSPTPHSDSTSRSEIKVGDTVFLASGVNYVFIKKSSDTTKAVQGSRIASHINLYANGNLVWNTYEPLRPFAFTYKEGRPMILGFDEVIQYMREGDRVHAMIPPELGYGAEGSGPTIPPNSDLLFDIEILSLEN